MNLQKAVGLVLAGYGAYRMLRSSSAAVDTSTISAGVDLHYSVNMDDICPQSVQPQPTEYGGNLVVTGTYLRHYSGHSVWLLKFAGFAPAGGNGTRVALKLFSKDSNQYRDVGNVVFNNGEDAVSAAYKFFQNMLFNNSQLGWLVSMPESYVTADSIFWTWNTNHNDDDPNPIIISVQENVQK